jgi:hypothetical protein
MKRLLAGALSALMSATAVIATAASAGAVAPSNPTALTVAPVDLSENGAILRYKGDPKDSYRTLATGVDLARVGGLLRGNGRYYLDARLIRFGQVELPHVVDDEIIVRDLSNDTNIAHVMPPATYPDYTLVALEDLSTSGKMVLFRMEKDLTGPDLGTKDSRLFAWNVTTDTVVELDAGPALTRTVTGAKAYRGAVDAALSADGSVAVFTYADAVEGCAVPGPGCLYDVYVTPTSGTTTRVKLNSAPGYVGDIAISGDGNFVAYENIGFGGGATFASRTYLRDLRLPASPDPTVVVSTRPSVATDSHLEIGLSNDGDRIAYFNSSNQPVVKVRSTNTTFDIAATALSMTMSEDGQWLAYATGPAAGVLVQLTPAVIPPVEPPAPPADPTPPKRLRAGDYFEQPVARKAGVPADATAAVLNVTAVNPGASGFLTVWPCGENQPTDTSSLNYSAGETTPNLVMSKLGTNGRVCIYSSAATDVLVDLNGYFPAGGDFKGITPARKLDTRTSAKVIGGTTVEATVTGGTVPATSAMVAANVTVTGTEGSGFLTVWPCGTTKPTTSTLNFETARDRANLAVATVGTGGKLCLFASKTTHVLVDVVGYFPTGSNITAVTPDRLLDTRNSSPVLKGGTTKIAVPAGNKAVALNVTVTGASAAGYATVWPCGADQPNTSNLNYGPGQDVPNAVIVKVGTNNEVCLYSDQKANYLADINATFPTSSTFVPLAPNRLLDSR